MNSNDPINSAIYGGIKRGISVCLQNECWGSAVILIYSGIDAMAFLALPKDKVEVVETDFVGWCEKYIRFPGDEQISGMELYSARCGMVHTFGVESRKTRQNKCRLLGYTDRCDPAILYSREQRPDFALVSMEALANAFSAGVDKFLVDLFADSTQSAVAERRLNKLVVAFPTGHFEKSIVR